ncbi:MAG: EndoU domain-containing protein, partial [Clostridia bacterium]|nr:EndoU domain-containing protein [Clostridia bacterium]
VGKGLGKLANKLPAPSKASKVAGDTLNVGDDILRKADDPLDDAIRYQSGKQVQNAIDAQLVLDKADDGAYKMTQNLRKHIELDGGPTGKSGIKGTHNKDNLLAEIEALGGQYRIKAGGSAVDGIEVIEYRLPMKDMSGEIIPGEFKNKVFTKTVYDPAKMSTEEFLDRGLQAANNAAKQSPSGKLPREWVGVDDSGVTWRGYCDLIEDKVTSFFPVD